MMGSMLRSGDDDGDNDYAEYQTYTFARHLNGNAWYRIGNQEFRQFMTQREFRRDPQRDLGAWVFAVYLVMEDRQMVGWKDYVRVKHRFQLTGRLRNYYRSWVNLTAVCAE
jgi:hypothetical protein